MDERRHLKWHGRHLPLRDAGPDVRHGVPHIRAQTIRTLWKERYVMEYLIYGLKPYGLYQKKGTSWSTLYTGSNHTDFIKRKVRHGELYIRAQTLRTLYKERYVMEYLRYGLKPYGLYQKKGMSWSTLYTDSSPTDFIQRKVRHGVPHIRAQTLRTLSKERYLNSVW